MEYWIQEIDIFVRETAPARTVFLRGRQAESASPPRKEPHPIGHVRLILADSTGRRTFGCSGDYFSVHWLDKRSDYTEARKMFGLARVLERAAAVYREKSPMQNPFELWNRCYPAVVHAGRALGQEDLTSSFASAMMERAILDAYCRSLGKPIFRAFHDGDLGFAPNTVHPELKNFDWPRAFRKLPATRFDIRHTVGLGDPIAGAEVTQQNRVGDGEPESLEEYIRRDGLQFFKIKASGQPDRDFERFERIWAALPKDPGVSVTIDANESYDDLEKMSSLLTRLRLDLAGFYQHILYLEQPVPRSLTFQPETGALIRKISQSVPVIIDEADVLVDSFKQAVSLGYSGTSHKNCKGFFKSLLNHCLAAWYHANGRDVLLSAEDMMNVPIVPLHQDFATLGILGLPHCERIGHHYNNGLTMLTNKEKEQVTMSYPDLYVQRNGHWFLDIRDGKVSCASLQCPGFGVSGEPDWGSMTRLNDWVRGKYSDE